jgi:DNA (cytosine-5)-methyltransferase 1
MKRSAVSTPRLTAVDLFAGAGGLSLGLSDAGFDVVGAVELDNLAAETYRLNHRNTFWECDIREVEAAEMLEALRLRRGELDLLASCPPCQGFSSVRTLNGGREVEDARNDLIEEVTRLVRGLAPRAVMMENVPALLADERRDRFVADLTNLGYDVRDTVLDVRAYGVPQRRPRYVLLAVRNGRARFAPRARRIRSVREAIGGLPSAGSSGDPLHDHGERRQVGVVDKIALIPHDGGSRMDLPESMQLDCHRRCDGFYDIYGRMAWDDVAPTITGGCVNPSKGRFLHPVENRSITLREAAVLQGFPPDYRFSMRRGKYAAAAMVGNALPPPFIERHARAVVRSLGEGARMR